MRIIKEGITMPKISEDVKELRRLWGGFWSSRVMLTANNLRIFDNLTRPKTAEELANEIGTDKRATEILMDALTGLGLLKKTSNRYRNTGIASKFLISGKPYYQGDILRHADTLWENWSGLDEVVKTGNPHHKAHNHDAFIMGMHNLAVLKVKDVLNAVNLRGVKTALDLGGGPGTYTIEMAKRGISVTLFDRPETIRIARDIIKNSAVKNINFIQGDFLSDDIGKGYDLVFISQVLHSNSGADNINVLKKSRGALDPHGRVAIQEFHLDEDRAHPAQAALFSINMLVNTESGRCYSLKEIKGWLLKTGFKDIKMKSLDDTILIQGTKSWDLSS